MGGCSVPGVAPGAVAGPVRVIREGAPGWAPIHNSAWGSPVGATPSRAGMAVVEPQAYGRTVLESRSMEFVLVLCWMRAWILVPCGCVGAEAWGVMRGA